MRRFSLLLIAAASVACFALAPGAVAGNFDEEKMGCLGENPATCPTATVGRPYSLTLYLAPPDGGRGEDFGCATFQVSSGSLPPGLSISDEGLLAGTPTAAGSYDFYLTVLYNKEPGCAKTPSDDRFVINVNPGTPPAPTVAVTTASLPDASINQPYTSPALTATGAAVSSWSLAGGSLPAGLALGANGVITGTPTQSGAFSFQVQANAGGVSATRSLSIFVLAPLELQSLRGAKPPTAGWTSKAAVNSALTTGVKAVGGRAPYTFSAAGTLPPGITLNPTTGALTGAGTTAGKYAATINVTDGTGARASVPWSFNILPLIAFVPGKTLRAGRVDGRYSAKIPLSGKEARTAQYAVSGQIPPGLDLDETTGRLTGTLLKAGNYRLRVFAFPATGSPISKVFRITVRA